MVPDVALVWNVDDLGLVKPCRSGPQISSDVEHYSNNSDPVKPCRSGSRIDEVIQTQSNHTGQDLESPQMLKSAPESVPGLTLIDETCLILLQKAYQV